MVSNSVTPNRVSLVSYNIEGLSSLYDADTRLYLSAFDFCLLVETFALSIPSHLFPEHDVIITPGVRLTEAVTARLSGGLALRVKKQWSSFVEQVHVEYDNMIVLKVSKDLLGTEKPVVLLGVYLPPSSSSYYHETDIQNGVAMIEQCILDVIESLGDLPLILFGDFNARTGNENSDAADTVDCGFDIFGNSEDAHSSPHRVSKDTVVNDFGRYLLNVCTEFELTILNGSVDGSNIGNYTYISPTGCSVVDYFVASKTLLSLSLRLNVGQRIE